MLSNLQLIAVHRTYEGMKDDELVYVHSRNVAMKQIARREAVVNWTL